jgi:sugar lactone lactonase YvrE
MRRTLAITVVAVLVGTAAALSASGAPGTTTFPEVIALPDGWLPEGIAVGKGSTFYSGSRANGAIYRGDLRSGEGSIFAPGATGRVAVGLSVDQRGRYLFVAGGPTGQAYVFDTDSGALVANYVLTAPGTFVNDVIVTRGAAYFTDSARPVLYRLSLGPDGRVDAAATTEEIDLSGDWQQVPGFNANGIEATPNGEWLIVVNSTVGALYRVDPQTGEATEIDLGGASVAAGDGLLLQGSTLYVVRNQLDTIVVLDLSADLLQGTVTRQITSPLFDVPTTIAMFGSSLYAVNARFNTPPTPTTTYSVVRVPRV